jgi:hypothetical protein
MPKPEETAVLEVNDKKFEDWESVWVEKHRADSFTHFRFSPATSAKSLWLACR